MLLGVFVVAVDTSAFAEAESGPCVPAVRLEAEEAVSAAVSRQLESHGVFTNGDVGCVRVVVQITKSDEGLELRIADIQGRTATRQVSDVETAAAVIEAWATPALTAPPPAPDVSPSVAGPDAAASIADETASDRGFAIGMWLGPSWAQDHSLWGDLTVAGCGRLGPVCLGGMFLATFDFGSRGRSAKEDADRRGFEFLGTVDLPILAGKFAIMPGVGVGLGWIRLTIDDDNPSVPTGQVLSEDDLSFRVGAYLRTAVEVTPHIRVGASVMFEFAPVDRGGIIQTLDGGKVAALPGWFLRGALGIQFDTF